MLHRNQEQLVNLVHTLCMYAQREKLKLLFLFNTILGRECCSTGIEDALTAGFCDGNKFPMGRCRTNYLDCCRCCDRGNLLKRFGIRVCQQASDDTQCPTILLGCCRDDFGESKYPLCSTRVTKVLSWCTLVVSFIACQAPGCMAYTNYLLFSCVLWYLN